ncbi:MAG: NfeD family protein [Chlamydiota bacterium]
MMWAPWLAMLTGLLMIYLEFYLPGGIMGAIGTIVLIANIVYAAGKDPSLVEIGALILMTLLGVIVVIKTALWRIKQAGPESSVYHTQDQEGYLASQYDKQLIGEAGESLTNLSPSGYILVKNQKIQAVSQVGFIPKGTKIIVVSGQGAHYIVKRQKKESH